MDKKKIKEKAREAAKFTYEVIDDIFGKRILIFAYILAALFAGTALFQVFTKYVYEEGFSTADALVATVVHTFTKIWGGILYGVLPGFGVFIVLYCVAKSIRNKNLKLRAEAEAIRKAEEAKRLEEERSRQEEEERLAEEERLKAEELARLMEEAEKARLKAEAEAKQKAAEERMKSVVETTLRTEVDAKFAEEAARRQAEEEAKARAEEEARVKADEEAAIKQAEEKARLKAEAEANQKAAEESMKAVVVTTLRTEVDARFAEESERRKAEEEARLKAEEEARLAAEEARLKSEEDKVESDKTTMAPIDEEELSRYFKAQFKGIGHGENYIPALVRELEIIRRSKPTNVGRAASMIYDSRHMTKRPTKFSDWMRNFYKILDVPLPADLAQTRYKPTEEIRNRLYFLL